MAAAGAARDAATATGGGAAPFTLRHLHLSLRVGFAAAGAGRLRGAARLELRCVRAGSREVVLDAHPALSVLGAWLLPPGGAGEGEGEGRELRFESRPFASYGTALHLALPEEPRPGELLVVRIDYETGEGPGVCWLSPEQTAGKQKPYMYTQGQAVLNRSFFPGFDTPAVKCTYSATVQVPEGFTAVMSATTWEKQKDNTFVFKMEHPIPSYLIALAVGDIVSAEVGPRSRVWAEPCLIEAAKKEYDGVIEEFLAVGEKLFGPYVWGRYDVLFMPPSFPFGGMENPCITFVTPCLLAGDRSLVDVIIHEISHSWFGNLVTNATWGEFWLNEGFTMYAQRRISTEVYGSAYTCLEAATGRALLRQHMDTTGEEHPLNKLRVVIEPGVNPDDTYNETPYEKGFCFVSYLAHLAGDQGKFDAFLQVGAALCWGRGVQEAVCGSRQWGCAREAVITWHGPPCPSPQAYVEQFKFQSITADDALNFFLEFFPDLKKQGVESHPGQRRTQRLGGSQPSSIQTWRAAGPASQHSESLALWLPAPGLPSQHWSYCRPICALDLGLSSAQCSQQELLVPGCKPSPGQQLGLTWEEVWDARSPTCGLGAPPAPLPTPLRRSGVRSLAQHAGLAALPARPVPGAAADEAGGRTGRAVGS
uniref:Arginyl aminopeptidase n=1 Tax=Pavo cristatus TaxID=9049 RepID=A0A8C9F1S0_PAVCR